MSVIYVLIPVAIILTCIGIYLFFWAVKTEQFDDLDKEGLSILFDDEQDQSHSSKQSEQAANTSEQLEKPDSALHNELKDIKDPER